MPRFPKRRYGRKSIRKVYKRKVSKVKPNYRKVKSVGQVKKVVKNMLSRRIETQRDFNTWILTPLCLQNTTGNLANNVVVLNPSSASVNGWNIGLGTGSNQMKGTKVRLSYAKLKYLMTLQPYNATINPLNGKPCLLRMYIFKNRRIPQNDLAVTNICGNGVNANFFESGNSDIGFIGNVEDYINKINEDRYQYLAHRTFKIGNAIQPNTTIGVGSPIYAQSNNDFKMSIIGSMNVTPYLKRFATRDDDGQYMDDYVFCLFQYVYADGTTATNVSAPIKIRMELEYGYTDA